MGNQMQPLVMEVEKKYGIKVFDGKKDQRGWILQTDRGSVLIKAAESSEAALLFCDSVYDHMNNGDFQHLLQLYKTKEGKTYFPYENALIQAFEYESLEKIDYRNDRDLGEIVNIMAKFHGSSIGFRAIPGSKVKTSWGRWIWEFQSYCMVAKKLKENLIDKRNKEKIEKIFLDTFDEYHQIGLESIEGLIMTNYLELVRESMVNGELCIHDFSEKNFLRSRKGPYRIESLGRVKHDIHAIDVGDCILSNIDDIGKVKKIIGNYHIAMPLSDDELNIIKAYVQFPQEYFKVIEKYYKNKKEVSHSYWSKKIKKAIKLEGLKKKFSDLSLKEVVNSSDRTGGNQQGRGNENAIRL